MKHRTRIECICLSLALLLLAGCGAGRGLFAAPTPDPTPTPVPTPTPAPTPVPVIALWGCEDAPALQREIEKAVSAVGYDYAALPSGEAALADFAPAAAHCVIVCCAGDAPAKAPLSGVYYCMLDGGAVPEGRHGVRYDGNGAVEKAFAELVAYPPHCEPVRTLGLFTGEDSAARAAYRAACDAGTFFSRGEYVEGGKKPVAEWLDDTLDNIYPGMLDCIFAETGALAAEAADALMALTRFDAEIFCASTSGEALLNMQEQPGLIVCAVGYVPFVVARSCVNNAILSIIGETPTDGTFLPETFRSEG